MSSVLWVCNTKGGILTGAMTDPNHQWTGQTVISLYNQSICFALIGPRRLFNDPIYTPMVRNLSLVSTVHPADDLVTLALRLPRRCGRALHPLPASPLEAEGALRLIERAHLRRQVRALVSIAFLPF